MYFVNNTHMKSITIVMLATIIVALAVVFILYAKEPKPITPTTNNVTTNTASVNSGPTNKPTVPTTETSCLSRGGAWNQYFGSLTKSCALPTTDAYKSCAHSTECQGDCIALSPTAASGKCSSTVPTTLSCWRAFEGTPQMEICY
jgi:hypothetical protein